MANYCRIDVKADDLAENESCSEWMDLIVEAFGEDEIKDWCIKNYPEWFEGENE